MPFSKNFSMLQKLIRARLYKCILMEHQQSYQHMRCYSSSFSVQLLPEVEQLLATGNLKHRQHPGVKKMAPIVIPANLNKAVDKLMTEHNEKTLLIKATELLTLLASRRLPMEMNELQWRIKQRVGKDADIEDLTKEQRGKLSREINNEFNRWKPLTYDYQESLAYLVGRLVPNYASIFKVFSQIKSDVPTFQPNTFLDFGSGVGSAVWAAQSVWGENVQEYFCVDASSDMNDISQTLLTDEHTGEMILKNVYYRQFLPASETPKYDLVVSAFSLMDLPSAQERLRVIDTLWRKTNDILVFIEFGNLAGFYSVLDARDYILQVENSPSPEHSVYSSGAHILMPCPHDASCPMILNKTRKSCGTYVSYETLLPRHDRHFEKDWISYVVLKKGHRPPDSSPWPRVVKPVLKKAGHVYCRMCCPDGKLNEVIVTRGKHGKNTYRCARVCSVGDSLPVNIEFSTQLADYEELKKPDNVE